MPVLPDKFKFVDPGSSDLETVQAILRSNDLPFDDCGDHLSNFTGIKLKNRLIAIGGFEHRGSLALLRSVAVDSQFRGLKLGAILVDKILHKLFQLDIESVYILTETAEIYFKQFGFVRVDREMLPAEIKSTRQCQSLCPASAIAMRLVL